jgi:hypothetical protein
VLTAKGIARRRLSGQQLITTSFHDPLAVVEWLAAVQAQDYPGSKWGIALRAQGVTDAMIDQALANGSIVRTHVLRPTWHLVAATDIRWMLELTGPRVNAHMAPYDRQLELDAATFRKSNSALTKALRDGEALTRAELRQVLDRANIGALSTQRLGHLLMRAELDRVICSGPPRGKQQTYALFDERVPASAPFQRDEAMARLARRYFMSRSPASAQDFSWWSGLTVKDARRAIEAIAGELREESFEGRAFWSCDGDEPAPSTAGRVWLVPNYDESFIGYRDRSAMGQRLTDAKVMERNTALAAHIVIADAQVVGGWRRTVAKKGLVIDLTLLTAISAREQKSLAAAARRYGEFAGAPASLVVTQPRGGSVRKSPVVGFRARVT